MQKKLVLSVALILLIGFIAFVSATMTPISPDGYNHNIGVHVEKGWNLILLTPILGASELDTTADSYISPDSEVKQDNIKVIYSYIRSQNKYIQMYPNAQEFSDYIVNLAEEDRSYLMYSSVWVYSDKAGYLNYSRIDVPKYDQVALENGWNFLTITPELKDKTFNEITGSCNIEKVCVFQRQNWECMSGTEIGSHSVEDSDNNIGTGMIVKVSNDCSLGTSSGDVPSAPSLPGGSTITECFDSDGGLDYTEMGIVTKEGWENIEDFCIDSTKLSETICNNDGNPAFAQYVCPNGCTNGECENDGSGQCIDSDGGLDYTEIGHISGIEVSRTISERNGLEVLSETNAILTLAEVTKNVVVENTYDFDYAKVYINDMDFFGVGDNRNEIEFTIIGITDFCMDENELIEWICISDHPEGYDDEPYTCPNGCYGGECL